MPKKKKPDLKETITELNKDYGKGTIINMGESINEKIEIIPTTIASLDEALGVGGFPKGRMVEVFGKEATGKTTLCLKLIASAQAGGLQTAYIDAEHELNLHWAKFMGVDVSKMLINQPECGEQALEIIEKLIECGEIGLIIIDSVAALVPRKELEGEVGDSNIGLHARLMSQCMRRIKAKVKNSNTCVVFINQVRMKIGQWGNPHTTPGGLALKFYAAIRLELKKMATLKKGDKKVGSRIKAVIVKNKVAHPFKEAVYDIIFKDGVKEVE